MKMPTGSKQKINSHQKIKSMKKIILSGLFTIVTVVMVNAQKGPLTGSGKIVNIAPELKAFTSIELLDMDGIIQVEAGKPYAINIQIDDNLLDLLEMEVKNNTLSVKLKGNLNNKLYIENTNIKVVIQLPALQSVKHRGNDYLAIRGISGNSFSLNHSGNGNVLLMGKAVELEIKKSGNGDINAKELFVQDVTVRSSGNGDVVVNADQNFKANGSGNGDIKNIGNALASLSSSKSGNGDIIDGKTVPKAAPYPETPNDTRIKTRIRNNKSSRIALKVVYPIKGSYGISIPGGGTRKEYFPLGTKIYREGIMKKILFEITPENRDTVLEID